MTPIQRPPGDLHVAIGAPWVGEVSFLQHHHGVEDMLVHEVHPYCRPRRHFTRAPLHWAYPRSPLFRKGHPVFLGDPTLCRGGPLASSPHRLPMSIHLMNRHGQAVGRRRQWTTPPEGRVPQEYRMSFPKKGGPRTCPVGGARVKWRRGRQCRCTSCTGMSSTQWLCWRKETSSTHGAPIATCRSPGGR